MDYDQNQQPSSPVSPPPQQPPAMKYQESGVQKVRQTVSVIGSIVALVSSSLALFRRLLKK